MVFQVLLWDDEQFWIDVLTKHLQDALRPAIPDFRIVPFERLDLALKAVDEEGPWNLLVTDLKERGKEIGRELVRSASKSNIPTIVFTVSKKVETIDDLFADYGILRCLNKSSFDHSKFHKTVQKVVFGRREMEPATYLPIIVEATKFIFSEAGKWLDNVRKGDTRPESTHEGVTTILENISFKEFNKLEADKSKLEDTINAQMADTHAYEIGELLKQIDLHKRNLIKFESQAAIYGGTTPLEIMNRMEHETSALKVKTEKLKNLLEKIYRKG